MQGRSFGRLGGACLGAVLGLLAIASTGGQADAQKVSNEGKIPDAVAQGMRFGAYDPHGNFKSVSADSVEHIFMPWEDIDLSTLQRADLYARERGRSLLVTVEPWSWSGTSALSPSRLRSRILSGKEDERITDACQAIGRLESPVTIRWGHEMDNRNTPYPWSGWAPADYIAAYRRMVDICRPLAPKAKFMWSPNGEAGLEAYYPGDAYVDEIGLSVFGLQRYDRDKFGHDRTFAEVLKPKYDRIARFDRPTCVAELGYSGDEPYNRRWAQAAVAKDPAFPRLECIVYFNDREPRSWPSPYGKPDWRVGKPETN